MNSGSEKTIETSNVVWACYDRVKIYNGKLVADSAALPERFRTPTVHLSAKSIIWLYGGSVRAERDGSVGDRLEIEYYLGDDLICRTGADVEKSFKTGERISFGECYEGWW